MKKANFFKKIFVYFETYFNFDLEQDFPECCHPNVYGEPKADNFVFKDVKTKRERLFCSTARCESEGRFFTCGEEGKYFEHK